jgi:hypothetical protein
MRKAPIGLQDLRRRLYVKAKTEPSWRFWGLYVHMCKPETLQAAYRLARENDGAHARQLSTLPFGRWYSPKTGRPYLGARPSARSIRKVCRAISERTSRQWLLKDPQDRVEALNPLLRGWANYFALGTVNPAYRAVDRHVKRRLRQWLCGKRKGSGRGFTRFPDEYLYHVLGIKNLPVRPHSVL